MKKCKNCGRLFEEPITETWTDDPSPRGVGLPSGYYTYVEEYCPSCYEHLNSDNAESYNLIDEVNLEEVSDTEFLVSLNGKTWKFTVDEDEELFCEEATAEGKEAVA